MESFLESMVRDLQPEPPNVRGRPRILPGLALWAGLLVCVLRKHTHQLALWRLLRDHGLWWFPRFLVSDQAVYKRLDQAGATALRTLFTQITVVLAERVARLGTSRLAPGFPGVYALDESTLDRVARVLPALRDVPDGDRRLLPGKLSALFDVRTQQFVHIEHQASPEQNEKVAARRMVEDHVPRSSLILADLGYFSFPWFDWLTDQGYHWVSRLRQRTSTTVAHTFYDRGGAFDGLVWLGAHRSDRAKHLVRLVRFPRGGATFCYITSVLDPTTLPLAEIARVYARRWDIELAFKLIKRHLGLHLLWSAKEHVILQQVWAVLIIAQVLQALRLEIAHQAGADPFEVSMALLVEYLPEYVAAGEDPIARFVAVGRELRFIRPSRRIVIEAPDLDPEDLIPPPPDLILTRTPRCAHPTH